ncbi:MAG: ABC transporter substrate-binding protein [Desulfocucumaceae bacterium]
MKKKSMHFILLVLLSSLMLIMAGCGSDKGKDTGKTNAPVSEITVRVGDITAAELIVPFHIAIEKGFFKEEGLKIDRKIFVNGPGVMMAMANGELDFCVATGFTPILQAAAQGSDVKILASMGKGNAPVVAGAHIKTFKDLDGKVVGTPGLGTIQNTMLNIAAEKNGIKFKKVIHGKITDLPVFLEKGEIDAFTGWEWPAADTVSRVKGAHYVLKMPVIENAESVSMGVNGKFYKENPETAKKFMRAYLKGVKYYKEHKDEGVTILAKMINRPEDVAKMTLENVITDVPEIDMPSVKFAVEDALKTGKIKKEAVPDIDAFLSKIIDPTLVKELSKEVGLK